MRIIQEPYFALFSLCSTMWSRALGFSHVWISGSDIIPSCTVFWVNKLQNFWKRFRSALTDVCTLLTFCVSRRRREMYIDHARLCVCMSVCVCLSLAACPHYCTDPDVTWGNGRSLCPLVVHYLADLQSVHGFCCYDNIARTRNASKCLYSLYAWFVLVDE